MFVSFETIPIIPHQGEPYIGELRAARKGYLNGITETDREFHPVHRNDGRTRERNANWPLSPLCNSGGSTRLRTATVELKEGKLSITTSQRCHRDPPPDPDPPLGPDPSGPDPNPPGPDLNPTGMTPRTARSLLGPVPSADIPNQDPSSSKGKIMKGLLCSTLRRPFPYAHNI